MKVKKSKKVLPKCEGNLTHITRCKHSNIATDHSNIYISEHDIIINDSKLFELILAELQNLRNEIKELRLKK